MPTNDELTAEQRALRLCVRGLHRDISNGEWLILDKDKHLADIAAAIRAAEVVAYRLGQEEMRERCKAIAKRTADGLRRASDEPLAKKYDLSYKDARLNAAAECDDIALLISECAVADPRQDAGQRTDNTKHTGPPHLGGA